MCLDKRPDLSDVTATESQKQTIQAILDLLEQSGQVVSSQAGESTSVLRALHLITSAMDGEKAMLCAAFIIHSYGQKLTYTCKEHEFIMGHATEQI